MRQKRVFTPLAVRKPMAHPFLKFQKRWGYVRFRRHQAGWALFWQGDQPARTDHARANPLAGRGDGRLYIRYRLRSAVSEKQKCDVHLLGRNHLVFRERALCRSRQKGLGNPEGWVSGQE